MIQSLSALLLGLNCGNVSVPPASYDDIAQPRYALVAGPWAAIEFMCNHRFGAPPLGAWWARYDRVEACTAQGADGVWLVYVPNDLGHDRQACDTAHELGHTRGWPSTHPGARFWGV